jgi:hypothetical protein
MPDPSAAAEDSSGAADDVAAGALGDEAAVPDSAPLGGDGKSVDSGAVVSAFIRRFALGAASTRS